MLSLRGCPCKAITIYIVPVLGEQHPMGHGRGSSHSKGAGNTFLSLGGEAGEEWAAAGGGAGERARSEGGIDKTYCAGR